MKERFRNFARLVSNAAGSPITFCVAALMVLIWASLGPTFKYSDTWQLVINTSTTIITFLMVFLIQNTQNRESKTLNLKVDELIRANKHARNLMIDLDEVSDEDLDKIHDELCTLNEQTEKRIQSIHERRKTKRKS